MEHDSLPPQGNQETEAFMQPDMGTVAPEEPLSDGEKSETIELTTYGVGSSAVGAAVTTGEQAPTAESSQIPQGLEALLTAPETEKIIDQTVERISDEVKLKSAELEPMGDQYSRDYVAVAEDGSIIVIGRRVGRKNTRSFVGYGSGFGADESVALGATRQTKTPRWRSDEFDIQVAEFSDGSRLQWNRHDIDAAWQYDPTDPISIATQSKDLLEDNTPREAIAFILIHSDGTQKEFTPLSLAKYEASQAAFSHNA